MGLTQKLGTIPLAIQTDSSNNVGIGGAANASYKLAVTGATTITGNLGIGGGANERLTITGPSGLAGMARWTDATTGSAFLGFTSGGTAYIHCNNNALAFGANSSNNFAATMTLTSGNVGIGTSSPSVKLNLIGGEMRWGYTSDLGALSYTDNKPMLASVGATDFLFYTNAAERMRIQSNGLVYITQAGNGHTTGGFTLYNTVNNSWNLVVGGDNNFYFGYNGASKGYFSTSSGAYTALSDANKKKDLEESTIGLDAILGLKPKLYRMLEDEEASEKHLGFIAQEVKDFIPQAYTESTNGDEIFIGLQDRPIIAALVKAIQELSAKVTALENK